MNFTRIFARIRWLAGLALLLLASSCAVQPATDSHHRFDFEQSAFGGVTRIFVYAPDEPTAHHGVDAALARMRQVEQDLTGQNPTSELSRLESQAGGPPVHVGEGLFLVLSKAREIARRSGGAYQFIEMPQSAPNPRAWEAVHLDSASHTASLSVAGARLNLSVIARGYAADQAIELLGQSGLPRALVQIGQTISAGEPPPLTDGWPVRLENADPDASRHWRPIYHAGVCSAGRSHPGSTPVTVLAPNALTAAPLAAAVSALGAQKGEALIQDYSGASAWFAAPTSRPATAPAP